MVANNFDEFIKRVEEAERVALNNDFGQELTKDLLKLKLEANPNLTPDEWAQTKSEFMTFLFFKLLQGNKDLMHEFGGHVYDELNARA